MRNRLLVLSILVLVLLGAAIGGGTFLGRSLSAAPQPKPSVQAVEGQFPLDFQGVLLDGEGDPVSNGGHRLTFSIYDRKAGSGGQLWSEEQTVFTLDGLFTAELGIEEDLDPNIFSSNRETFLGIRVGNDPELTPRIRLAYAPYAMHAITAENVTMPPLNPKQIALGRWYEANRAGISIPVDDSPGQMVFDGENVWVTTKGDEDETNDDNITKIRVSDGSKLLEVDVTQDPSDMVFDGRNIWVSIRSNNELFSFRPDASRKTDELPVVPADNFRGCDDTRRSTTPPPLNRPTKMVFDGTHIWVLNSGSNTVSKIRVEDGTKVKIIEEITERDSQGTRRIVEPCVLELPISGSITDLAFDGERVWVLHTGSQNVTLIKALNTPADREDEDFDEFMISRSVSEAKDAIAFDGNNMWIINRGNNSVSKVRVSDMEEIETFDVGQNPTDIAFDGRAMWIVNEEGNNVTKLRASDGELLGTFFVGEKPTGIVFDGANMWVSNQNENTVVMR